MDDDHGCGRRRPDEPGARGLTGKLAAGLRGNESCAPRRAREQRTTAPTRLPPTDRDDGIRPPARRRPPLVADRRHLPDLSPLLPGLERRRHRRPAGHHRAAGLPRVARRGRRLDLPDLPVADGRLRLRRRRLHGDPPALRHAAGLRAAARRDPPARHEAHPRLRAEPHVGPASLVPPGATTRSATGTSGTTATSRGTRRTTGGASSAAARGSGTSTRGSTTTTPSSRSSPT